MRIRNILTGRCGHRPLQPTSQNAEFEGRTESSAPTNGIGKITRVMRKTPHFLFCTVGVTKKRRISHRRGRCLHRPAGNARFMAVFRRIRGIVISRRRGGRPCPPAGNSRFYGNPMRIRNILTGRCGHRPLQPTSQNAEFEGRTESSAPTKARKKSYRSGKESPHFLFCVVGAENRAACL